MVRGHEEQGDESEAVICQKKYVWSCNELDYIASHLESSIRVGEAQVKEASREFFRIRGSITSSDQLHDLEHDGASRTACYFISCGGAVTKLWNS